MKKARKFIKLLERQFLPLCTNNFFHNGLLIKAIARGNGIPSASEECVLIKPNTFQLHAFERALCKGGRDVLH